MRYDISKRTAPEMPNLGKGTECIKLLLSQASKDMYEPLVPMFFPVLGAHISGAEFQYPDLTWKEMCGQMAHLVADSGNNKAQLGNLVEAICRDFLTLGYCRITCPYCTITCRYRTIRQGYFAAEKYSRNT